jgi:broad specificity phosphatase PhoE
MNDTTTKHPEIWLIRHGETQWSLSGQHTGRTDIPLTENGRSQAEALQPVLAQQPFDLVLCSPLTRAQDTCRLAGLGAQMQLEPRLLEWNYGIYEGRKTQDIRQQTPGWSVWDSPMPDGEDVAAIQQRAESLIDHLLTLGRLLDGRRRPPGRASGAGHRVDQQARLRTRRARHYAVERAA